MDQIQPEYRQFIKAVDWFAELHQVPESDAALRVMVLCVMAMAADVPTELRPALQAAVGRWYVGTAAVAPWEPFRLACWQHLDDKNGNSTTIADRTDTAVRALICVLGDELSADDYDMTLDFFGSLMGKSGLDAVALVGLKGEG